MAAVGGAEVSTRSFLGGCVSRAAEDEAGFSPVGDFGGPAPHWDMKESTVYMQSKDAVSLHGCLCLALALALGRNSPRERGMLADVSMYERNVGTSRGILPYPPKRKNPTGERGCVFPVCGMPELEGCVYVQLL